MHKEHLNFVPKLMHCSTNKGIYTNNSANCHHTSRHLKACNYRIKAIDRKQYGGKLVNDFSLKEVSSHIILYSES